MDSATVEEDRSFADAGIVEAVCSERTILHFEVDGRFDGIQSSYKVIGKLEGVAGECIHCH